VSERESLRGKMTIVAESLITAAVVVDRTTQDILMDRLAKVIHDKAVRRLIRRHLQADDVVYITDRDQSQAEALTGALGLLFAQCELELRPLKT
jgi:hypothetical protein